METVVKFKNLRDDGVLVFQTEEGKPLKTSKYLYVKSFKKDGVMEILVHAGRWLDTVAEIAAGCFEEGSNLKGLTSIKFEFCSIPVVVTKKNCKVEQIISQWETKRDSYINSK